MIAIKLVEADHGPICSVGGAIASRLQWFVAKVEWHPGELYPRVGFIVTNLSRPAESVVRFYKSARHL
jgi:hypothetical protein